MATHILLTDAGAEDVKLHAMDLADYFGGLVYADVVKTAAQLRQVVAKADKPLVILTSLSIKGLPTSAQKWLNDNFKDIQPLEDLMTKLYSVPGITEPVDHPLELIFRAAIEQVTRGKGERHGGEATPFYDQQWVFQAKVHGNGFLTGQAAKKLTEAVTSGNRESDPDAFEREILGAIVYLGMALLHVRGLPEV